MKGLKRIAFMGIAAVAGLFGVNSGQQREIARTNADAIRQTDKAGLPIPQAPASRVLSSQSVRALRSRGASIAYFGHPVWIGRMRDRRGCGCTWRVGARGRSRLGGRS